MLERLLCLPRFLTGHALSLQRVTGGPLRSCGLPVSFFEGDRRGRSSFLGLRACKQHHLIPRPHRGRRCRESRLLIESETLRATTLCLRGGCPQEMRAPITIPSGMAGGEAGAIGSPMPWASDYAAPTPSFPLTPQAQQEKVHQAQAAQRESQQRAAAVVLQCLSRSHMARAQLAVLREQRIAGKLVLKDAQEQAEASAAAVLQAVCRAHLVQQLRAWFVASTARVPAGAAAGATDAAGNRRSVTKLSHRAARRRHQSDRRRRSTGFDADLSGLKSKLNEVSKQASDADVSELTRRIRRLEKQLGRGLGEPDSAAAQNVRRRRRSRARTPVDTSSSSLRVKARPTVATIMGSRAADIPIHDRPASDTHKRRSVRRSKSAGALGSTAALEQFSAEWSHGTVDGWSQWLPRHRWFQGLASQLHALHSLADPLRDADDDTRSYIREYVERELSHPHRAAGHRMDGGNAVQSAVAHSSAWRPGSASISSLREFGAPPELPHCDAPTSSSREHWVTRLSRRSTRNVHDVSAAQIPGAQPLHQESLQVTLRQDAGGTTGFGIVLQCEPGSSSQDRRLQPPSNAIVTAVTPGSDASAAGVVAGMGVLSVNGNRLRPDTSVGEINKIFEEIVGLPAVDFEFEAKGLSTWPNGSVGSVAHGAQSSASVHPNGWCEQAQIRVAAASLGRREAMVVVVWDGGGTAHTAASSMCEHAAHQIADVLAQCFTSGLVRDIACIEAGPEVPGTNKSGDSAAMTGHVWSRTADDLLRQLVPDHTAPTGGRIAWSTIAAKMTGWSNGTSSPFMYSSRGCQARWEDVLDPRLHQWTSLRPPQLSIWWCNGVNSSTGSNSIVPEQLHSCVSADGRETMWPSEDEVVTLVGARIHHHLETTEQDTEDVVSALHKQVRQQMNSRRELHAEIGSWQAKNKELERECAKLAAAQLAQKQPGGRQAFEKIYNAIASNPLHPRAAPSRETTPAGAAAEDLAPTVGETTAALLPVTDVTTVPMPVLSVDLLPDALSEG